jgi:hypothetical protein
MLIKFRTKARPAQARRNEEVGFEGGFFHPFHPGYRNEYTCSLCQYVCHPKESIRLRRFKLIRESGVSVPDERGGYKAVKPEEAKAIFDHMPRDRREMYLED